MNLRPYNYLAAGLVFIFLLSACNLGAAEPTPVDLAAAYTQAAQTVEAVLTGPAPTSGSIPLATTPAPTLAPTTASQPSDTPAPSATAQPAATTGAEPSPTAQDCTDAVEYVSDVTIPDGTSLLPGEQFVKTWRLLNTGTCTWTTHYSLVFVDGEAMNGASPSNLSGSTPPGQTADISVTLRAPGTPGTYQGNWQLRNPNGQNFGLGAAADQSFWVKILVEEGAQELNLGSPAWTDTLDSGSNWFLLDTPTTRFEIEDGKLKMRISLPGAGDDWGMANQPPLKNFYIQATFVTGDTCSGRDRYGLIVRAPDPSQGYVFGFSCDGRYRLYDWDGQTYRPIQEWHESASIHTGPNTTNQLGIWLDGSTIRLYANRRLLAEYTDTAYDEGQFGVFIGSGDTENLEVFLDEVSYWNLGD